jgi:glycosyltransferase involved in cell wall biosynthesis
LKKLSVIIPCYNKEYSIEDGVARLQTVLKTIVKDFEIIIIDDCSDDDSYLLAEQNLKADNIKLYRKTSRQGKGAAIRTGYRLATGDFVAFLDADLQIDPSELVTFIRVMNLWAADVVIGNKRHDFSNVSYSFQRRVVSCVYNGMVRFLFGIPLRDTQCGIKLFKKSVLDKIMSRVLVKQYAFDLEILVALRSNNVRVADAPVYVKRQVGKGSVSMESIRQTFKDTLAVWWRNSRGYYLV